MVLGKNLRGLVCLLLLVSVTFTLGCDKPKKFTAPAKTDNSSDTNNNNNENNNNDVVCAETTVGPNSVALNALKVGQYHTIACSSYHNDSTYSGSMLFICESSGSFNNPNPEACVQNAPQALDLIDTNQIVVQGEGVFRTNSGPAGAGGVYFSNGGQFCWFSSPESYNELTGGVPALGEDTIPQAQNNFSNSYDGICGQDDGNNIKYIQKGPFKWSQGQLGENAVYYSDGTYYCWIPSTQRYEELFPNDPLEDLSEFTSSTEELGIKNFYTGACKN